MVGVSCLLAVDELQDLAVTDSAAAHVVWRGFCSNSQCLPRSIKTDMQMQEPIATCEAIDICVVFKEGPQNIRLDSNSACASYAH